MLFHLKQQIIKRMELSALQQKVGWNFLIQIFSKTLTTILGIWTLSLISHHLGPSDFGYFYTIFAFVQLASVLTDGGLALITLQDLGRPDLKPKEVLGQQIIFRIGLTLITEGLLLILVFLLPVSAFNNNLKLGIIILSAGNIFIALSQTLATILQKKLKTSYILISEVSGRLILILGVFWFIQKRHHLYVLLVIFIISQAGQMIITFYTANKELTPSWKIDPQYLKKTFQRFWPLAINNLASLLYFKADTLMLSLYHQAEIVGKYGIPYRILETLLTIPANS